MRRHLKSKRGDTLIEVMLSISIFFFFSMLTINMMNDGINTAQRTLEAEMARNEIDAQAEALRFIHNNYVAERQKLESESQFRTIWNKITSKAIRPSVTAAEMADTDSGKSFDINDMKSCDEAYASNAHLDRFHAFILNTRLIMPELSTDGRFRYLGLRYDSKTAGEDSLADHMIIYRNNDTKGVFNAPSLYPRLIFKKLVPSAGSSSNSADGSLDEGGDIYNSISRAEGVWIDAVSNIDTYGKTGADYYDFYIRTCWQAVGQSVPSTITTVVRLYNPEVME